MATTPSSYLLVPWETTMKVLVTFGSLMISFSVVSGKLSHAHPEVVQGQGLAAPPPGYHPHPPPRQHHKVQTISEFDQPGGFQPGGNPYAGADLGPTTEQVFVSGPPLGDEFLSQYQKLLESAQLNSQLTFEGLLLSQVEDRKQKRHQEPQIQTFSQAKPPVTLDYHSDLIQNSAINNNFNPNGKWPPTIISNPAQIHGKASFSPNKNWFGDKQTNLAKVSLRSGPVSQEPLINPSTQEYPGRSFSPSDWLDYRQRVIETGTRPSRPSQNEPSVITIDNINQFVRQNERPDVFDVNVQAVLRTRNAQKTQSII